MSTSKQDTGFLRVLGRRDVPALVWVVDAGGLGIVIGYAMVAWSFLVLRYREPDLARPYKVPLGNLGGTLALLLALGLGMLYLPGSPSSLLWPQEWAIVIVWSVLGALLYSGSRKARTEH